MQGEGRLGVQGRPTGRLGLLDGAAQHRQARAEGRAERVLLGLGDLGDQVGLDAQVGPGLA